MPLKAVVIAAASVGLIPPAAIAQPPPRAAPDIEPAPAAERMTVPRAAVDAFQTGDYRNELEAMERALAICPPNPRRKDLCLDLLIVGAAAANRAGRSDKGEIYADRAAAIALDALGEMHPDTGEAYHNLASALNRLGRPAEAEPRARRAIAVFNRTLGEGDPYTGLAYDNLGTSLLDQGRFEEARTAYRHSLAILRRNPGERHPATARTYNNIGSTLHAQGRAVEAEVYYRRALAINRAIDENLPETALGYNNVGTMRAALGRPAEALQYFQLALAILRRRLGDLHPDIDRGYNNIGGAMLALGRATEAEPFFRQALRRRDLQPEEHVDVIQRQLNLADLWDRLSRHPREAFELRARALESLVRRIDAAPIRRDAADRQLAKFDFYFADQVTAAWKLAMLSAEPRP